MKNVLVTGGAGFIGAHFILHLLSEYDDIYIVNYDKLTYAAELSNLDSVRGDVRYKFIKGDICDCNLVQEIIEQNCIDTIVNFAAESHVDNSIQNADVFAQTNIMGVLSLLQAAKDAWKDDYSGKRFVQISTDEVYGSADNGEIFYEDSPLKPGNPYSASKASADIMCMAWHNTYNFPIIITRSSNNFGPFQHEEKFMPTVIKNAIKNKPIPIYGDGQNVRDWIFVKDNVIAIDTVIKKGEAGEVYNISTDNSFKNIDIAKKIIDVMKNELDVYVDYGLLSFVTDRKGHDLKYSISSDKYRKYIGAFSKSNFEKSLAQTIRWYATKILEN